MLPKLTVPSDEIRRKHAVIVSAALVTRRESSLAEHLKSALAEAFTPTEIAELILQSLLFDGYPCALEGFLLLKDLLPDSTAGAELFEAYTTENSTTWRRRGEILCCHIYGDNFNRLLENVGNLSPTLKEWMLVEGYGRVLGRSALSINLRELGIIAILTIKNLPRQLHSHLRGALHVGIKSDELDAAIRLCTPFTSPGNIRSALQVWNKVNRIPEAI